ncbi:hypothetical protein BD410DRAFT_881926 [Rickenella mellea]|uniref:Uncharacterized protein n=1 Tax=Rickenella mellea TaxID=50990 RepID=A0A4Y7QGN0_9AGAM|nr:hypothetical protein BD410DRAFT_881926 [Rickenella mellea]
MTSSATKYEDIPPRFRKAWIPGNEQSVQRKLDVPLDDGLVAHPLDASCPDSDSSAFAINTHHRERTVVADDSLHPSKRRKSEDDHVSTSHSLSTLAKSITVMAATGKSPHATSRVQFTESQSLEGYSQTTESILLSRMKRARNLSNASPTKVLPDVATISRVTSRQSSPGAGPSKWTSITLARRSNRRFDVRPWGPRHLEYDYSEARKEFQSAAYFALGQSGYVPPRGRSKNSVVLTEDLPSMEELRKVPLFRKACEKLDRTDKALEIAIALGQTWDNTPVPSHYLQLSLDEMRDDDIRTGRVNSADEPGRSRSSVTLEETANGEQLRPSSDSGGKDIIEKPSSTSSIHTDGKSVTTMDVSKFQAQERTLKRNSQGESILSKSSPEDTSDGVSMHLRVQEWAIGGLRICLESHWSLPPLGDNYVCKQENFTDEHDDYVPMGGCMVYNSILWI